MARVGVPLVLQTFKLGRRSSYATVIEKSSGEIMLAFCWARRTTRPRGN
jgi:hypothetical protein